VQVDGGNLGVLYETGDLGPNETITFRRVSLAAVPIYPSR